MAYAVPTVSLHKEPHTHRRIGSVRLLRQPFTSRTVSSSLIFLYLPVWPHACFHCPVAFYGVACSFTHILAPGEWGRASTLQLLRVVPGCKGPVLLGHRRLFPWVTHLEVESLGHRDGPFQKPFWSHCSELTFQWQDVTSWLNNTFASS